MDADAKLPEGVGSMRTPADKEGRGAKIDKIWRAFFMDGPFVSFVVSQKGNLKLKYLVIVLVFS